MANKMLIDASHPEETRVVVLRGNRVEEFDFESASKKQLRGNIYLAKVTRVEPSLQAAFVEYGGNRHGFLAFSEIHPDYYQIPIADRQALIEEEARNQAEDDDEDNRRPRRSRRLRRGSREPAEALSASGDETIAEEAAEQAPFESADVPSIADAESARERTTLDDPEFVVGASEPIGEIASAEQAEGDLAQEPLADEEAAPPVRDLAILPEIAAAAEEASEQTSAAEPSEARRGVSAEDEDEDEEDEDEHVEQVGGDELEEMPNRVRRLRRQYKIQEVIKRRQVLLVQVVKEERGNKGAALTTYLSLAGRYSVLMPNTARGGGISRKITDSDDRKRLKSIVQELDVPEGMGVILRTAGAARTKQEVQRDFEYLLRMWETVRELTLKSSAPTLVYEEGSLIKRSIRDLYNKDVEEVLVAGEDGYAEARDFMRLLIPSQVKSVVHYKDLQPIFARYGVETQLDAMFSNQVTLRSGGYLVINQTEALVAIDVNSGRSTREHNIEDTALRTNLEAADEVARQLRLRDLAGLIVVDFIDMEEHRNNRAVERRLKEALKNDRARIQVGRISHFGLLEMSRQRIRSGVLEGSTIVCPHCLGSGVIRSTASVALHVLRVLEDALIKNANFNVTVKTRTAVALYILNQKRAHVRELEERFDVSVTIAADDSLTGAIYQTIERGEPTALKPQKRPDLVRIDSVAPTDEDSSEDEPEAEAEADAGETETESDDAELGDAAEGEDRPRRRRRRRRRGRDREKSDIEADAPQPSDAGLGFVAEIGGLMASGAFSDGEVDESDVERESSSVLDSASPDAADPRRRRRRPRRVTLRRSFGAGEDALEESEQPQNGARAQDGAREAMESPAAAARETPRAPAYEPSRAEAVPEGRAAGEESAERASPPAPVQQPELPEAEPPQEKRSGWWQRAKATFSGS